MKDLYGWKFIFSSEGKKKEPTSTQYANLLECPIISQVHIK